VFGVWRQGDREKKEKHGAENMEVDTVETQNQQQKHKQVHLFYCLESEELARKVAGHSDLITLQSINWRSLPVFSLFFSCCTYLLLCSVYYSLLLIFVLISIDMMWVFAVLVIFLCSPTKNGTLLLILTYVDVFVCLWNYFFVINKFSFTILPIVNLL
jgi:K+-sensing histidine kinase KdpD